MRAFAVAAILGGLTGACVANTLREAPAGTPGCVGGGGDTVAANRFFEFQVETPARLEPASTASESGTRAVGVTFVVDTAGRPQAASVRAVAPADSALVATVRPVVAGLRFEPARLGGCRVQQVVQQAVMVP